MVRCKGINKEKVYNPRTKKIYVLGSAQFNESFSYYDTSPKIIVKDNNSMEFSNI